MAAQSQSPAISPDKEYILYGTQLSPFALKLALGLALAEIPFKWHWQDSTRFRTLVAEFRIQCIKMGLAKLHVPAKMDALQEFPQVPFLLGKDGLNGYDSSSLCLEMPIWKSQCDRLEAESPAVGFLVSLLDAFFNEWGLYLVHHKRWTDSGNNSEEGDNVGHFMANEGLSHVPSFLKGSVSKWLNVRQTTRLPYLFSVSAVDAQTQQNSELPKSPAPEDLFPTHDLLNQSFTKTMSALENIFTAQKFLFGEAPTLADLSCFGQINMLCLLDRGSRKRMEEEYPHTVEWIDGLQHICVAATGVPTSRHLTKPVQQQTKLSQLDILRKELQSSEHIQPLLAHIFEVFVPLMQQNELAFEALKSSGETLFNEAAFDQRRAMYEGTLCGQPFKHVAKTFQVHSWRTVKGKYAKLSDGVRRELESIIGTGLSLDEEFFRNGPKHILSHL